MIKIPVMQLESLQVFCDVARLRSFSQAAVEARPKKMTQSAVSQIISHLEERVGVQLIDRSTRPLQLTTLGQRYYEGCKTLLEQYAELEASLRSPQGESAATVEVAAIYSVGLSDMGQYVQRFTAEQPGVQVHIEYHHPDRVYERILEGTADLGLVSYPRRSPKLTAVPWKEEEMVLACAPQHPLAGRLAVAVSELAGLKYIHFDRKLAVRRGVDRFLREQNVKVEVALEFDSIENIKQAVAIGAGVALLPEPTFRREVRARTLLALPLFGCHFTRPLGIIHRRARLSAAAKRFKELLQEESPEPRRADSAGLLAGGNVHISTPPETQRGRNHSPRSAKRTGS
jgi:DNA-binding transcriptional LysR family regulator